jgi:hypothetical protein
MQILKRYIAICFLGKDSKDYISSLQSRDAVASVKIEHVFEGLCSQCKYHLISFTTRKDVIQIHKMNERRTLLREDRISMIFLLSFVCLFFPADLICHDHLICPARTKSNIFCRGAGTRTEVIVGFSSQVSFFPFWSFIPLLSQKG